MIGRLLGLALLLWTLSSAAAAQAVEGPEALLLQSRRQLDELRPRIAESATLEALSALRAEALAVHRRCVALSAALAPQLANLDARLAGLGAAPPSATGEEAALSSERRALTARRTSMDAQLRLARLLAIEGEQAAEQIDDLRRARFSAKLGGRTASLLDAAFWVDLRDAWPDSRERMERLLREAAVAVASGPPLRILVAVLLAALIAGGSVALLRRLPAWVTARVPPGRLRRSTVALARTLLPCLAVLFAGHATGYALTGGTDAAGVEAMEHAVTAAAAFGTYVASLGSTLLSVSRPTWRLLPLPDAVAVHLRRDPWMLGGIVALSILLDRWVALAHLDLAIQIAVDGLVSLVLGLLLVWALRRGERARRQTLSSESHAQTPLRSLWLLAIEWACWIALVASITCLLSGYVALGSIIVKQAAWLIIVASSAFVLITLFDDACAARFGVNSASTEARTTRSSKAGVRAGVLLAAVCRLAVIAVAGLSMLGPLGQSPHELLDRAGAFSEGVSVGKIRIMPGALAQAMLLVVGGIWAVGAIRRWLVEELLPTTEMDDGMRESVVLLLSWTAYIAILALALSAIGLGLERVTWIASALSVGIGFGLRVFVQNFLSGLVLLTERSLSVGDLVVIDGIEGEIRRINLRTTELESSDHSMSVIPNFVFATKVIRSISNGRRKGRVEIKLPLPLDTDVDRVLETLLACLLENDEVLAEPEPEALVDGAGSGRLVFIATASISTPRRTAVVRSALLREMLARLTANGVDLQRASSVLLDAEAEAERARSRAGGPSPTGGPVDAGAAPQPREPNLSQSARA